MTENQLSKGATSVVKSWQLRLIAFVGLLFWLASLYDLATHTSRDTIIFGRYSIPLFLGIIIFAACTLIWLWLVISPNALNLLNRALSSIRALPILGLILTAVLTYAFYFMVGWTRFEHFRLFQFAVLFYLVIVILFISFWGGWRGAPLWRKAIMTIFGVVLAGELMLQLIGWTGNLPGQHTFDDGVLAPYGRVYNNREGFGNGITNRYGYYTPEFDLTSNKRRIAVIGDGFLEGTQHAIEDTLAVQLEQELGQEVEILALSRAGFGPAQYFEVTKVAFEYFDPDEIIFLFNTGDDFLNTLKGVDPRRSQEHTFYLLREDGSWTIDTNSLIAQHYLEHWLNDSSLPIYDTALRSFRSHLLLPKFISAILNPPTDIEQTRTAVQRELWHELDSDFAIRGFMFDRTTDNEDANDAITLTTGLLGLTHQLAQARNVPMRIVTVPVFTNMFFTDNVSEWTAEVGNYDLFKPENIMIEFARQQGISILPMGAYLETTAASVDEIQALYLENGTGHFSAEGHAFFADAIATCFYDSAEPCPIDQSLTQKQP